MSHPERRTVRFIVEGSRAFPGPSSLSLPIYDTWQLVALVELGSKEQGGPGRAILASLTEPVVSALTGQVSERHNYQQSHSEDAPCTSHTHNVPSYCKAISFFVPGQLKNRHLHF